MLCCEKQLLQIFAQQVRIKRMIQSHTKYQYQIKDYNLHKTAKIGLFTSNSSPNIVSVFVILLYYSLFCLPNFTLNLNSPHFLKFYKLIQIKPPQNQFTFQYFKELFLYTKIKSLIIKMQENSKTNNIPIKEGYESLPQQDQQPITLLRIPFYAKSQQSFSKILTSDIIQKVQDKQEFISLSFNTNPQKPFKVNIFKKKLVRAMQLLKVKKLVNKKTGKIIKIIKKTENIQTLYDYQQLGDFINSLGSQTLYGQKKYAIKQQDILKRITKYLTQKIHSNQEDQKDISTNDQFFPLIQPLFYLKSYNLVPPSYDLLMNKLKPKFGQNTQIVAKSINYQDEIPQPQNLQIPKFIYESELFKKVAGYLEKRPCWLKNSLYYTLFQEGLKNKFTVNDFKNVMKYSAFTYRNGPWKHAFCKFGFDPKKEFKSLIFQSVTIKIKEKEVQDYGNEVQEEVYDPTFQQDSNRFVRSYQLCDIANETVREIVQGKLLSKQGECTKEYGWLNSTEHGKIMKTMKLKVQD